MEEMKEKKYIGKYIRNKYGIAKIVNVFKAMGFVVLELDRDIVYLADKVTGKTRGILGNIYPITEDTNLEGRIKNIIDLIEIGDYVNGYNVINKDKNGIFINNGELQYDCILYEFIHENNKIKSILTREQVQANQYVVEEG